MFPNKYKYKLDKTYENQTDLSNRVNCERFAGKLCSRQVWKCPDLFWLCPIAKVLYADVHNNFGVLQQLKSVWLSDYEGLFDFQQLCIISS